MKAARILTMVLVAGWAHGATITGTLQDVGLDGVATNIVFTPLSTPNVTGGAMLMSRPKTVTTDAGGAFSLLLAAGDYQVKFGGVAKDGVIMAVPTGTNSYNWTALVTNKMTYTYQVPPTYVLRSTGTQKGDLLVYDGLDWKRLAVGTDGQVLQADSTSATGVKYFTSRGLGTVTSVGLTSGSPALVITGSPVTAAGTLGVSLDTNQVATPGYVDAAAAQASNLAINRILGSNYVSQGMLQSSNYAPTGMVYRVLPGANMTASTNGHEVTLNGAAGGGSGTTYNFDTNTMAVTGGTNVAVNTNVVATRPWVQATAITTNGGGITGGTLWFSDGGWFNIPQVQTIDSLPSDGLTVVGGTNNHPETFNNTYRPYFSDGTTLHGLSLRAELDYYHALGTGLIWTNDAYARLPWRYNWASSGLDGVSGATNGGVVWYSPSDGKLMYLQGHGDGALAYRAVANEAWVSSGFATTGHDHSGVYLPYSGSTLSMIGDMAIGSLQDWAILRYDYGSSKWVSDTLPTYYPTMTVGSNWFGSGWTNYAVGYPGSSDYESMRFYMETNVWMFKRSNAGTGSPRAFAFPLNDTNQLYLDSNGRVGVGKVPGNVTFDVNGSIAASSDAYCNNLYANINSGNIVAGATGGLLFRNVGGFTRLNASTIRLADNSGTNAYSMIMGGSDSSHVMLNMTNNTIMFTTGNDVNATNATLELNTTKLNTRLNKTLTDNLATNYATISIPTGTVCAVQFDFALMSNGGGDFESHLGRYSLSAVNKAGTITVDATETELSKAKSHATAVTDTFSTTTTGTHITLTFVATHSALTNHIIRFNNVWNYTTNQSIIWAQ